MPGRPSRGLRAARGETGRCSTSASPFDRRCRGRGPLPPSLKSRTERRAIDSRTIFHASLAPAPGRWRLLVLGEHGLDTLLHLVRRDVLLVGGDPPEMAEGVLELPRA